MTTAQGELSERGERQHRIVVGVDGSQSSRDALAWAAKRAELTGDTVDAVIAWQYPAVVGGYGWGVVAAADADSYAELAAKVLSEAIAAAAVPAGVTVRQIVRQGFPAQVLLDAADGAGLLVVGSRGHGGFAGLLLGSVSQQCAHHATCPVVIVRPHGTRER